MFGGFAGHIVQTGSPVELLPDDEEEEEEDDDDEDDDEVSMVVLEVDSSLVIDAPVPVITAVVEPVALIEPVDAPFVVVSAGGSPAVLDVPLGSPPVAELDNALASLVSGAPSEAMLSQLDVPPGPQLSPAGHPIASGADNPRNTTRKQQARRDAPETDQIMRSRVALTWRLEQARDERARSLKRDCDLEALGLFR